MPVRGCTQLHSKNDRNLEMVTIKSLKLKSIGKNAFKGINNKVTIKVPDIKVKVYKKIIKSKGAGKKINVKK